MAPRCKLLFPKSPLLAPFVADTDKVRTLVLPLTDDALPAGKLLAAVVFTFEDVTAVLCLEPMLE